LWGVRGGCCRLLLPAWQTGELLAPEHVPGPQQQLHTCTCTTPNGIVIMALLLHTTCMHSLLPLMFRDTNSPIPARARHFCTASACLHGQHIQHFQLTCLNSAPADKAEAQHTPSWRRHNWCCSCCSRGSSRPWVPYRPKMMQQTAQLALATTATYQMASPAALLSSMADL
jgi:hypothetical protein